MRGCFFFIANDTTAAARRARLIIIQLASKAGGCLRPQHEEGRVAESSRAKFLHLIERMPLAITVDEAAADREEAAVAAANRSLVWAKAYYFCMYGA